MAGLYPTSPGFQTVDFMGREYEVLNESMTGATFVQHLGGQRWEFTVRHDSLSPEEWRPVMAFLEAQDGARDVFQVRLPVWKDADGGVMANPTLGAAAAVGAREVVLTGASAQELAAGDFVQFGSKVYMLTSGGTQGNAGRTFDIKPGLMVAAARGDVAKVNEVEFTVRKEGPTQQFTTNSRGRVSYETRMVEVL